MIHRIMAILGRIVRTVREIYLLPIHAYRLVVSPHMPPVCKYTPSCSRYFVEAVRQKGIVYGTLLGAWRVLRCNPWSKGGFDPVR